MKGFKPFPYLALSLYFCVLTACGGSHPQNGPGALNIVQKSVPDGVVLSPYSVTMGTVGGQGPFAWQLDSGTLPPGLSLTPQGVISGTPPMSDLNSDGTAKKYSFVLKVTDSQMPTSAFQTGSFSITINPLPKVTTTSLPDGTIGLPYQGGTLTESGGLAPFTWSCPQDPDPAHCTTQLPAGLTLSASSGMITGIPTGPAGDYSFTIQVTDALSNTASANLTITIKGKLQGTFAFSFNGFDNGQPFYTVGSFVGDGGGTITSGVLDQNDFANGVTTKAPFTGTYSIGTNGLGTMTLTIPALSNVTYTYNLAPSLTGDTRFILADPNFPNVYGSGVIKAQNLAKLGQTQQTGLMALAGNYALGFFGVDTAGHRSAGAGAFKADNSGNLANGIEDTNDNGTVSSRTAFTGSWALDTDFVSTGRGTATLNVGAYAFYVVDPSNELIEVQTDPASSSLSLVSLLKQLPGSINGSFSNGTLNASAVMELNGVSTSSGSPLPDVQLGVSTFDGVGNITLFQTDENNGGTYIPAAPSTGTYSVEAATGRVTVTGLGSGPQPVWYLVNANRAFVIGTDASVTQGSFEPQAGAPFSLPSFLLRYAGGTIQPVLASVTNEVDSTVIPAPGGTLVVTYDSSGPGGPQMNLMLSSTYALGDDPGGTGMNNTGKFILTAAGSPVPTAIVYMITAEASGGTDQSMNKWASINIATPAGSPDANPRLTVVQSTSK